LGPFLTRWRDNARPMKKTFLLLLLLVGPANVVYAQLPVTQLPVTDGLVAHWDFQNDDLQAFYPLHIITD